MQKIITLIAVILLSGCSMLGANFDNNEYASLVRLQTESHFASKSCSSPDQLNIHIDTMMKEAEFLHVYTKHLPRNKSTHKIATLIRANIIELRTGTAKRAKSVRYCEFKIKIISRSLKRAMEAVTTKVH